jgi:hypothetical protein
METFNYNIVREWGNAIDRCYREEFGDNIEELFYKCRLEIIEKILEYERNDDINPTTFVDLVNRINELIKERKYFDTASYYKTKRVPYPTYCASIIRWYHKVYNHVYFSISYNKKLNKYELHYEFYIDNVNEIKK